MLEVLAPLLEVLAPQPEESTSRRWISPLIEMSIILFYRSNHKPTPPVAVPVVAEGIIELRVHSPGPALLPPRAHHHGLVALHLGGDLAASNVDHSAPGFRPGEREPASQNA